MIELAVVVALAAYPVIAGMAWRKIQPTVEPEPLHCGATAKNSYGSTCKGAAYQSWPDVTIQYRDLYCEACIEWARWKLRQPPIAENKALAWLWPVSWIPWLALKLFNAGARTQLPETAPTQEVLQDEEARR